LFVQGCSSFSHTNKRLGQEPLQTKATFKITQDRGETQQKVLFILSLSGGGSRAAYFSTSIIQAIVYHIPTAVARFILSFIRNKNIFYCTEAGVFLHD